jgi:hypothetical protein
MDLLYPARLVFHYERLMSLAFVMAERPVTALLLGVSGAAMSRFVRAYLPGGLKTPLIDELDRNAGMDETVSSKAFAGCSKGVRFSQST